MLLLRGCACYDHRVLRGGSFNNNPRNARCAYRNRNNPNMQKMYQKGEISLEESNASVQGWVNHVRYGNTIGLRKALLSQPTFPFVKYRPGMNPPG